MLKKLLLTGAAGHVGTAIRPFLPRFAETVLLSDIEPIGDLAPHESFKRADLGDRAQVDALFEGGVDGVFHLGGVSLEKPFEMICHGNLIGAYNMFDAARLNGRPRMIFASSNHVTGFYRRDERIDVTAPIRPDSLYGASKAWGEALASLYYDKFGVECLTVRIGFCFPKPTNPRSMAIWLSAEDLADLCARAFSAQFIGHTRVYGASDNDEQWWDNRHAAFLGWRPKHSSAQWRAEIIAGAPPIDPRNPDFIYQAGHWATMPHPNDYPAEQG